MKPWEALPIPNGMPPKDDRTAKEALALHAEYQRTRDQRLRDRLVIGYAGIVKHIVYRKLRELPAWCEVDDLLSCGVEALIAAVDRFDPAKGATFAA